MNKIFILESEDEYRTYYITDDTDSCMSCAEQADYLWDEAVSNNEYIDYFELFESLCKENNTKIERINDIEIYHY